MATAYCLHCRKKREMTNVTEIRTKNIRKLKMGKCKNCGYKVSKFVKA